MEKGLNKYIIYYRLVAKQRNSDFIFQILLSIKKKQLPALQ